MSPAKAQAIIGAVAAWARGRDDVRAVALVGSWARGKPQPASDIDLVLLSDRAGEYRRRRKWLSEIDFRGAGYAITSSRDVTYGVVWSRHVSLLPVAEVELTFARCAWARTDPIEEATRTVAKDALRIILDKDGTLAKLVRAVTPM